MAEGFLESIGTAELLPIKYQEGYNAGKASMSGEYTRGYNAGYSAGAASVPAPSIVPISASNWTRYSSTYFHAKLTFSRTAKGAILGTPTSSKFSWSAWDVYNETWPMQWKTYVSDTPSSMTSLSSPLLNVNQAVGCHFTYIGTESSVSNLHTSDVVWYLRAHSIDIFFNSLNVPQYGVTNPGVSGITNVNVTAMGIFIF